MRSLLPWQHPSTFYIVFVFRGIYTHMCITITSMGIIYKLKDLLFRRVGFFSEKAMAPPSALAWKIPWTEEPGGLQSMGSRRVRHYWATSLSLFTFMHWRRKWQPTRVLAWRIPWTGAWWAAVYGVAQSQTRLKRLSSSRFFFFFSSSVDQRMRAFWRMVCKLVLEGRDKFEYSETWSSDS